MVGQACAERAERSSNAEKLQALGWRVVVVWECEQPEVWMNRLKVVLGPTKIAQGPCM